MTVAVSGLKAFTKSKVRNGGLVWIAGANLLEKVIQFITYFGFSFWLHPSDYGIFALAWVVIAIAESFFDFSIGLGFMQDQDNPEQARRIYNGAAILCALFWTAICALVGAACYLAGFPEIALMIFTLSVLFICRMLTAPSNLYFMLYEEYRLLAFFKLVPVVVGGLAGILVAIVGGGAWALVSRYFAAGLIGVFLVLLFSPYCLTPVFNFSVIKNWLSRGWKLAVSNNMGWLLVSQTEQILIASFLGSAVLGIYNYARKPMEISAQLLAQIAYQYFLPRFVREGDGARRVVQWALSLAAVMLLAVGVFDFAIKWFAYDIWPEAWWPAFDLMPLAMLCLPPMAMDSILSAYLAANYMVSEVLKINITFAVSSILVVVTCVSMRLGIEVILWGAIALMSMKTLWQLKIISSMPATVSAS